MGDREGCCSRSLRSFSSLWQQPWGSGWSCLQHPRELGPPWELAEPPQGSRSRGDPHCLRIGCCRRANEGAAFPAVSLPRRVLASLSALLERDLLLGDHGGSLGHAWGGKAAAFT